MGRISGLGENAVAPDYRYFLTYSGVKLPVRMVSPLDVGELPNRNTYIRARYDDRDRLIEFEKIVYGEVELTHSYQYDDNGVIRLAEISMGGERSILKFESDQSAAQ